MARVTIQVLEGLERGRVFADLEPPISIGREDDNVIRLNDERISRFHAKIQRDGEQLILTDLESTNGTRVNGHPVQMRVLQLGDTLAIGRCLLLVGSRDEISSKTIGFGGGQGGRTAVDDGTVAGAGGGRPPVEEESFDFEEPPSGDPHAEPLAKLFPHGAPPLPEGLPLLQTARLSDVIAFVHSEVGAVIRSAFDDEDPEDGEVRCAVVAWPQWQQLLQVEMELARYLRRISEPDA